jgi:hypothetical protein
MHLTNGVSASSEPMHICQRLSPDGRRSARWSARIVTPSTVLNHSPAAAIFNLSAGGSRRHGNIRLGTS